jgi:hypothetical protein
VISFLERNAGTTGKEVETKKVEQVKGVATLKGK